MIGLNLIYCHPMLHDAVVGIALKIKFLLKYEIFENIYIFLFYQGLCTCIVF